MVAMSSCYKCRITTDAGTSSLSFASDQCHQCISKQGDWENHKKYLSPEVRL